MSGAETYFFGTGTSADVARSIDWQSSPLGPIEGWPSSLRTTLSTLFHSRHPMFLWWGPELIQFYNDAYLPSFGVGKHPTAMGQPGRECWPEIWPLIGPQIENVMLRGMPSWNEDQLVPIFRNGRLEEVYWTYGYSPVFDDLGRVGGTLVVCTETTSRVLAERRLALLRSLGDALLGARDSADALQLSAQVLAKGAWDVPFAILVARDEPPVRVGLDEPSAAQVLQSTGRRVAAPELVSLAQPAVAGPWPEPVTAVYVIPFEGAEQIVFGIGPRLPFDERCRLFLAQLTRQIEAARARARLENERRSLLELAPVPTALMTGPDYVFEIANDAYCEMVGRDVRGRAYFEAFPELRESPLGEILCDVYRTGRPFQSDEMRLPLTAHGRTSTAPRYFKFNLAPILGPDGCVSGVMAIAIEITDQVLARTELQLAARAKDDFLAMMSHELRTPLNAMLGWTKILKNNLHDRGKLAQGIEVIERNTQAQARIVGDLLDVSRIISGKLKLSLAPLDLASAVRAALDVVRPAAEAKQVRLESTLGSSLGTTFADPDRIHQVLWNLLSNAIRFTPAEGTVRLSVERAGAWFRIRVADTGQGIRSEHLLHIFERFRQVDTTSGRAHGGLGLGLAIVRYLVEAHGGSVSAQSDGLGAGATFEVLLPMRTTPPADDERDSRVNNLPPAPLTCLDGVRVLAIDDHRDSLAMLCEILGKAGASVTPANGAAEALDAAGPFDVIISDIGMPIVDGYEVIRRIRAREADAHVPAIALTAYARADDVAHAKRAGFQAHLAKPLNPDELLAAVRRLVGRA